MVVKTKVVVVEVVVPEVEVVVAEVEVGEEAETIRPQPQPQCLMTMINQHRLQFQTTKEMIRPQRLDRTEVVAEVEVAAAEEEAVGDQVLIPCPCQITRITMTPHR